MIGSELAESIATALLTALVVVRRTDAVWLKRSIHE
jgi:hypothetical protein